MLNVGILCSLNYQYIMSHKISVITVVYNDVANIRQTMESYFSQTWEEKEYIVIDGGSTDGTVEIIKEYADRIAYWCSEKDHGIYDAMNKGITHATGDWINVLNSGDLFADSDSLKHAVLNTPDLEQAAVIYGNSIRRSKENDDVFQEAPKNFKLMEYGPIYRHGSSLIRADIQKTYLYELSKQTVYGFALDWLLIYQLYKKGYKFQKTEATIEIYQQEGVSNDFEQSLKYNRMIITGRTLNFKDLFRIKQQVLLAKVKKGLLYHWLIAFLTEFLLNDILPHIPFWSIRRSFMKKLKMQIGLKTFVMKSVYIMTPQKLTLGDYTHINRGCVLDARGGLKIGSNVSVSHNVSIMTGSHDHSSKHFRGRFLPVVIEDFAWIGVNATILQNVRIGKGAVVCAGAVVTKDVAPYSIVAGIPAREISKRNQDLDYHCIGYLPLT